MTQKKSGSEPKLHKRAEEKLWENQDADPGALSHWETRQLFHELRMHQIELKMQNEELLRTRNELECSRAHYFDLYDLAPVGYLALTEGGLIREANLAAATMLGVARGVLVGQPISRLIIKEDQNIFYHLRKKLFESHAPQASELRLVQSDGTTFWVHLAVSTEQNPAVSPGQYDEIEPVVRVVLGNISERKRAEEELQLAKETATAATQAKSGVWGATERKAYVCFPFRCTPNPRIRSGF